MVEIYTAPKQYSISRVGLEVYRTDEENFKPYQSVGLVGSTAYKSEEKSDDEDSTDDEKKDDEKEEEEDTSAEEETDKKGYTFHQGKILDTYYYNNIFSTEHEADYKDMSDSASIKISNIDKKRFYKGVRLCLKKQWEAPGENLTWEDLSNTELGFITEQTFSESNVSIKISGMSVLLEESFKFDFKQMKRSKILEEIIKCAGLTPHINVKGLDDDVTDFSNLSSDGDDSSSDLAGGEGEEIDSLVAKIVGSETNELAKAKKIHEWLKQNVIYGSYECTHYNTPEKCLANKSHLNCADTARLTRAMMASAGLDCYVVHGPYHFWVMIEIGGKKYASDQTGRETPSMAGSEFNTVWWQGRGRSSAIPPYSKNGKNPSC